MATRSFQRSIPFTQSEWDAVIKAAARVAADGLYGGGIGSGARHVLGGVAGTIQCVLGRLPQITSRPDLHHFSALFGSREYTATGVSPRL